MSKATMHWDAFKSRFRCSLILLLTCGILPRVEVEEVPHFVLSVGSRIYRLVEPADLLL